MNYQIYHIMFCCSLIFFLQATNISANETFLKYKRNNITVIYPESLQHVIPDIIDAFHRAKNNLHTIFVWSIHKPVRLIIIKNRHDFLKRAEHPLVVAFANPSRNIITMNYQAVIENPFSLETTLQHELCHILLGEHLNMHIPRWLNEGIAQWASEGITEIIRLDKNILQKAAFSGNLIPFHRLNYSFPMDDTSFELAYEQSQSFIVYLVREYHKSSLFQMLELMKSGQSLHTAIRSVYGKSMHQLEYEWVSSQTQYLAWILFVINNLYTFLFVGMALISILGYIRMKRRKWNYPDDWDADMLQ